MQWTWVLLSALALAAAYVLTVSPHELAHSVVAACFGLDPMWHADRAPHLPGTAGHEAAIAAAGPIYSLASGALALAVTARVRGYFGLLASWFGLLGVAGFCGYLISGPVARSGDVPDVLRLLDAPPWLGWSGAVVGIGGLLAVARIGVVRLAVLAPLGWGRPRAVVGLGVLAVPLATVLVLAAGIPIGPPLIAQLVILVVALLVGLGMPRLRYPIIAGHDHDPDLTPRLLVPMGVLLALTAIDWLVLRPGVPL
jgi:hypothetical protein